MFNEPSQEEKLRAMAAIGLRVRTMHEEIIRVLKLLTPEEAPRHLSEMAPTLWPLITPEVRAGWNLMQGVLGVAPHSWFRFAANPEEVVEPSWIWTIDPAAPAGIQAAEGFTMPTVAILPPWSCFASLYRGKKVL